MPDEQAPWVIKGVPDFTRRMVKGFAALNHMTMAQAIQLLVSRGLAVGITTTRDPALGVLRDMPDAVLAELVKRVDAETQRRNSMPPEDRMAEEAGRLRAIGLGQSEPSGQNVQKVDANNLMAETLRATDTTDNEE